MAVPTTIHIYCDESHLAPFRYRVQGGIWVAQEGLREVRAAFRDLRGQHPKAGELRWGKVDGKVPWQAYYDLIDLFTVGPAARHLTFKCIVVDREDDASHRHGVRERDLGFYKTYWTLLSHRLRPSCTYHIRLDRRSSPRSREPEQELQARLNKTGFERGALWDVATCRGECSKQEDLLQLADVLCGVIGWAWNDRRSTCAAKPLLEKHIAQRLNFPHMGISTSMSATKVNIWKYLPKRR